AIMHPTDLRHNGLGDRVRPRALWGAPRAPLIEKATTAGRTSHPISHLLSPIFWLLCSLPLLAGPGHDHGPAMGISAHTGPVTLSEAQRKNLDLQTTPAAIVDLAPSVEIPAILVVPPEKHGSVSAPFAGRVLEVLVKLGQQIQAGDPVVRVAPLAVGSPAQTLASPVSGHVIRQNAMPGLAFTPETTLVEVGDDTQLLAQGLIFQSPELNKIQIGAPAALLLDVFPGEEFPGVLQRLDTGHAAEDPGFHLYAAIPNPAHRLRPNYRGLLRIALGEAQPAIAIPRRAILGSLGKLFVFVENEDGAFEKREVVTGIRSGNLVEILEGVLPDEKVVTVGNYQLQYLGAESAGGEDEHGHGHSH
ncbi:MAG: efflux RND transporter periplasmic adaptor subunit, partial [Spartobacteria bacterium]